MHRVSRKLLLPVLAFIVAALPGVSAAQIVIGFVEDGPLSRPTFPIEVLAGEVSSLSGDELDISFPVDKQLNGGWTLSGIRDAIQRQLDDPDVDIVVTTGFIASNEAARFEDLPKPVIAMSVADLDLQEMPSLRSDNRVVSGRRNFTYIARVSVAQYSEDAFAASNIDETIDFFYDAVEFEHLAVLVDRLTIESIPRLSTVKAREVSERLGVETSVVSIDQSIAAAIAAIPADTDAVMVSPLLRLSPDDMRELANGLIERRLPSFSLLGRVELGYGLLLASGGREEDLIRYARRLALNVQRIALGDDPGDIDIRIAEPQRLAINMQTAEAIGFYPRYAILADAEELFGGELAAGEPLALRDAMITAVEANLNLAVSAIDPMLAAADRQLARSQLLPQLGLAVRATQIDADRANPLFQSERTNDALISGSQVIYSDDAAAQARIAAIFEHASILEYETAVLDTLQSAAESYLTVMRARAREQVQRSNLEVTRANLELARLRRSLGSSGRGDVLRWESQIATDRQNLVIAEADRRASLSAFNQILNRPKNQSFQPADTDVTNSISVFQDNRFRALIDNAAVWELFQNFMVEQTIDLAPEIARVDRLIQAQERQVTNSRRKYYIPDVSLSGSYGSILNRGGAGSDVSLVGVDDESWNVAVSASWPLFTGGLLRANLNRDRLSLRQLERTRAALAEQLETRTRVALHRASGSYPALEFSVEAAAAATENLALVTDAYRIGTMSVTDLIDAQNAALAADLRAADAGYVYLIDAVNVLRASGDFSLLLDNGSKEPWFQEVEAYIRNRNGVAEPR